jgi:hypothetical protein
MVGNPREAERLAASQEGLSCMELIASQTSLMLSRELYGSMLVLRVQDLRYGDTGSHPMFNNTV